MENMIFFIANLEEQKCPEGCYIELTRVVETKNIGYNNNS